MGIPGLWKILEPTQQTKSLLEIAVREGFQKKRHGTGTVVVGVDASPMIFAAGAIFDTPEHPCCRSQAGESPELQALFFRLAWLSRSGVSAVFVFDGPDQPKRKSNKAVQSVPHWLTAMFQEFIHAFGFHYHMAPGEAEAELAFLNVVQAIDIILTSDSDVFLFGATQVMRSPLDSNHLDNVTVFTEDAFKEQQNPLFTVAGLLFIAVLSGDDYDTVGLPYCEPVTAMALASGPLAKSLYNAARHLSGDDLTSFLACWKAELRDELENDPNRRLGCRRADLAANVPSMFPNPEALKQYYCPVTSIQVPSHSTSWIIPAMPNTVKLGSLCECTFRWGPHIIDRFISNVWDGYLIRKFIENAHLGSTIPTGPPNLKNPTLGGIRKVDNRVPSPSAFLSYQVIFWIPSLIAEAASGVLSCAEPGTVVRDLSTTSMLVWIPEPILNSTHQIEISNYHICHPRVQQPHVCGTHTPDAPYSPVLESDTEFLGELGV